MKLLKFGRIFNKHNLGRKGEELAKRWLKKYGYVILETNYRSKLGEIDIVALDEGVLVFVEVKTRSSSRFGSAKEAVDRNKQKRIIRVAQEYLKRFCPHKKVRVRFDVVGIDLAQNSLELIKGAFEADE